MDDKLSNEQLIIQNIGVGVITVDNEGNINFLNSAAERSLQQPSSNFMGRHISSIFYHSDQASIQEMWKNSAIFKCLATRSMQVADNEYFHRKGGDHFLVSYIASPLLDTEKNCHGAVICLSHEVEHKLSQQRLMEVAGYDDLTQLPNARHLKEYLFKALDRAKRGKTQCVVLYIDIDNFTEINASFGREIGDLLLKQIGERFSQNVRGSDFVAKVAADEYAVVLENLNQEAEIEYCVQRIMNAMVEPFLLGVFEVNITLSMGVSIFPSMGDTVETLLANAAKATETVKKTGKNEYRYFSGSTSV